MTSRCPNQVGLRVATLVGLLVVAAAQSPAQQPGGGGSNPFDGQWTLVWDVATAPGGATLAIPGGTISPYNAASHAAKEQFHVKEDGSIEWAQSDAGSQRTQRPVYTAHDRADRSQARALPGSAGMTSAAFANTTGNSK